MLAFVTVLFLVLSYHLLLVAAVPVGSYARLVDRTTASKHGYDFVIVGGGAAGLTVADRLTEDSHVSVLVIERGPLDKRENEVLVPGLLNLTSTSYWYNLTSLPQTGLNNRTFQVPAAKVVGGGTTFNGMFFDRGSAADYNAWEEIGNPGWGWDDLLPYFRKSENYTPPIPELAQTYNITWVDDVHGFNGPVQASYPVYQFPAIRNFLAGWRELGASTPQDPGAGTAFGVFYGPSSLDPKDETRSYARTAHYDRVSQQRSNYHLLPDTVVSRIVFEGNCTRGVQIVDANGPQSSQTWFVKASREVIVAAGVHSAQVLQLSGIGDSRLLTRFGIGVVADLPGVGQNFQDHPTFYPVFNCKPILGRAVHPNGDELSKNATYAAEQLALYWARREGAYTITAFAGNTVTFLPFTNVSVEYDSIEEDLSNNKNFGDAQADAQSTCKGYQLQRDIIERLYQSKEAAVVEYGFSSGSVIPVTLVKPFSRGSLSISSASVFDSPVPDWGSLTHPVDIKILAEGLKTLRRYIATSSMQELLPIELSPGTNITSDTDIETTLRQLVSPTYSHPCCAAPMMPQELGGVVDSDLRVYGVRGLRVVDASIFPLIPATHTSSTVYAVAEKAADLIKATYQYKSWLPKV